MEYLPLLNLLSQPQAEQYVPEPDAIFTTNYT